MAIFGSSSSATSWNIVLGGGHREVLIDFSEIKRSITEEELYND